MTPRLLQFKTSLDGPRIKMINGVGCSPNGTLTVKSAYKVATKEENSAHSNTILGNIWKSSIHDRLKMLLWRIGLNILPTKSSIALFASNFDTNCPLCSIHVETPLHLFWQCPLARALWFNSVWGIRTDLIHLDNILQLIEMLLSPLPSLLLNNGEVDKLLLCGAIIMDLIWKARNSMVHENILVNIDNLLVILKYREAEHWARRRNDPCNPSSPKQLRWVKLVMGEFKANCDAAVGDALSTLAVVVRDWRGIVVLAISRKANTSIPLQAEAEALLWAAQLANDHGFDRVCFESDSKICMDALLCNSTDLPWRIQSCLSAIIQVSSNHSLWSFNWVKREANGASHSLASWALKNRFWGLVDSFAAPLCFVDACKSDLYISGG
jgi:ribonuclease HI